MPHVKGRRRPVRGRQRHADAATPTADATATPHPPPAGRPAPPARPAAPAPAPPPRRPPRPSSRTRRRTTPRPPAARRQSSSSSSARRTPAPAERRRSSSARMKPMRSRSFTVPPSPVRSPLEAVHRLSEAVLRARTPADVTGALVARAARRPRASARSTSPRSPRAARSATPPSPPARAPGPPRYVQVLDERPSGVAWVVATGEPLIVPDARGSQDVRQDLVERFDVASMAYLPARWGGEVRYVAILISHEPRDFDAEAIAFAETLANQAAAALALLESERRRAAARRARRRADPRRRSRWAPRSSSSRCSRRSRARPTSPWAARWPASTSPTARAAASPPPATTSTRGWTGIVLSRGEGVAGRVLTTGEPFVTNAYQTEIETAHDVARRASRPPPASRWCGTASSRARCRSASPRCAG